MCSGGWSGANWEEGKMEMVGVAVMSLAKRLSGRGGLGVRAFLWQGTHNLVVAPLSVPPLCRVLRMMEYQLLHLLQM